MGNIEVEKQNRDGKYLYKRMPNESYEEFAAYIDSLEPIEIGSYYVDSSHENEEEHRLYPDYKLNLPSDNIYLKKFSKLYIKIRIMHLLTREIDENGNEGPEVCRKYGFIPMFNCKIFAKLRVGIRDYVYVDPMTITGTDGKTSCWILLE